MQLRAATKQTDANFVRVIKEKVQSNPKLGSGKRLSNPKGVLVLWIGDIMEPCPHVPPMPPKPHAPMRITLKVSSMSG